MKNLNIVVFLFLSLNLSLTAQMSSGDAAIVEFNTDIINNEVAFSNQNNLLSQLNFSSEIIVGVADMNGDKLDDIIRLDNARFLTIEYQSTQQTYNTFVYGEISNEAQWSLAIADVDANGYNDILLSGDGDGVKLLKANNNGTDYSLSILPDSYFFAQGSNFSDIDNDGHPDVFVCNDEGDNHIWENDGTGNFSNANNWIDMSTAPPSDNSGNYASIWTDFDNDGDLDLYISKCKGDAIFPTDPERINQLFVNENGTFSEQAELYGLKIGAQSWTSDFQDVDNDGDLDCLVINHMEASQLLENDGNGFYTDITIQSGLQIITDHLQGQMRDFDNDGFVDILLAGNNGYEYYENNGDQTFTKVEGVFGNYHMGTYAFGDLNHDGFLDVYSGSASSDDVLWMNSRNENHFFSVNLTGTESNINALGSRLKLYGSWGVQIREVRAGESYGINNSFTQHFGLGDATQIDSLVVEWPSGLKESFVSPQVDQFLNIVENECAYPDWFISSVGGTEFCTGDSLLLKAPSGTVFEWSNGDSDSEIYVSSGGTYKVTVTNSYGCTTVSNPLTLVQDPDETPQIVIIGNTTFCDGQSVTLFSTDSDSWLWSTNETTQNIVVEEEGTYFVSTEGLCASFDSEPVEVTVVPLPETPVGQNDTIVENPSTAILTAIGENLHWYDAAFNGTLLWIGNSYETDTLTETTAFYVEAVSEQSGISCSSTRVEVMAVFDIGDGIIDLEEDASFLIFPNPAAESFVIKNQSKEQLDLKIQIISLDGKTIKSLMRPEFGYLEQCIIDLDGITSGLYILSLTAGDQRYMKRVVVQR